MFLFHFPVPCCTLMKIKPSISNMKCHQKQFILIALKQASLQNCLIFLNDSSLNHTAYSHFLPVFPGVMKCAFHCYLFLIHSVPPHTLLPGCRKAFEECRSRPVICWQSIYCCWLGMSNGITTVLITSPHTCAHPCITYLIAPLHPHPCFRS